MSKLKQLKKVLLTQWVNSRHERALRLFYQLALSGGRAMDSVFISSHIHGTCIQLDFISEYSFVLLNTPSFDWEKRHYRHCHFCKRRNRTEDQRDEKTFLKPQCSKVAEGV